MHGGEDRRCAVLSGKQSGWMASLLSSDSTFRQEKHETSRYPRDRSAWRADRGGGGGWLRFVDFIQRNQEHLERARRRDHDHDVDRPGDDAQAAAAPHRAPPDQAGDAHQGAGHRHTRCDHARRACPHHDERAASADHDHSSAADAHSHGRGATTANPHGRRAAGADSHVAAAGPDSQLAAAPDADDPGGGRNPAAQRGRRRW